MASEPAIGSMLACYRENRIAQQTSYWTAFGVAAGQPPGGQAHQHECAQAVLCDRRRLGTVPLATVPAAQDSLSAGALTLPPGPGAASFGDAAGARGIDRQHPVFVDR